MIIKGKTALVTGASKGIGEATALALAAQGANIIVNYNHDNKAAQRVVDACKRLSVEAIAIQADISKEDDVDYMFSELAKQFKTLDIVVNNAGVVGDNDNPDNLDAFYKVFQTNLFAQANVTTHARRMMKAGKIVFISSVHGQLGHGRPSVIAYSSSKAALNSYVKNLAKDVAPTILVNAVAPGRTMTTMWGEISENEKKRLAAGHLTNKWIKPDEIADAVLFLIKNDAVCGEILTIDGGMSLKTFG